MAPDNNSGDRKIRIEMVVDNTGALKSFKQLEDEAKKTGEGLKSASKGFSFTELNQGLELASKGFAILKFAANEAIEAVKHGSDVNNVTESFKKLSAQVGISSAQLLKDLQEVSKGTISNYDLMIGANRTLQAGLKPEVFEEAIRAARAYAETVGGNAKDKLDEFTQSLLKGKDRAFEAIGITVDTTKATLKYANSIGVLVDSLSEEQKKEAVTSAGLEGLKKRVEEIGEASFNSGDNIETIGNSFKNIKDDFDSSFAGSEGVTKGLEAFSIVLGDLPISQAAKGLGELAGGAVRYLAIGFVALYESLSTVADQFIFVANLDFKKLFSSTGEAVAQANKITDEQTQARRAKLAAILADLEGLKKQTAELEKNTKGTKDNTAATKDKTKATLEELKQQQLDIATKKEQTKLYFELRDSLNFLEKNTYGVAEATAETVRQFKDGDITYVQAIEQLKKLAQGYREVGAEARNVIPEITKGADAITRIKIGKDNIGGTGSEFLNGLFGINGGEQSTAQIGSYIAGLVSSLGSVVGPIAGGQKTNGSQIAGSAAQIGSVGGAVAGAALASSFGVSLATGLSVGGPIGAAVGLVVGTVVSQFFNTDSKATKVRKSVDNYFADLFNPNRLGVIINGQLQQLDGLFLGGSNAGDRGKGFFAALDSLPESVASAFSAVGDAFGLLTGSFATLGHNLGASFADDLGGSLENLQLLIQATGKSFEELSKQIINAFLDGQLSFVEAQTDLQKLNEVFEVGIPGAIGATVQAFQNLQDSSTHGGRASVDSLRDLAAEARELNLTTVQGLEDNLLTSGKLSSEQVKVLFNELQKYGITTLDGLQNITDEQALSLLANLQTVGFQFKESAKETQDIVDKVNNIPSKTVKDLVFRVDLQYSPAASTPTAGNIFDKANVRLPVGVQ